MMKRREQTEAASALYQMSWDDERYGICGYELGWHEDCEEVEVPVIPGVSLEAARALNDAGVTVFGQANPTLESADFAAIERAFK